MKHFVFSQAMCKVTYTVLGHKVGKIYRDTIERWSRSRGNLWTAKRLKELTQYINLIISGEEQRGVEFLKEKRINFESKKYFPWKVILNALMNSKSQVKMSQFYTVLKVYTGIAVPLTQNNIEKVVMTINHNPQHAIDLHITRIIDRVLKYYPKLSWSLINLIVNKYRRHHYNLLKLKLNRSRLIEDLPRVAIDIAAHSKEVSNIWEILNGNNHFTYTEAIQATEENGIPLSEMLVYNLDTMGESFDPEPSQIRVIPKPGAEGRPIALMSIPDQLLMQPIHIALEQWRSSKTFNDVFAWKRQQTMIDFASSEGKIFSTDLSSATDTVPVDLFTELLKVVGQGIDPDSTLYRDYQDSMWDILSRVKRVMGQEFVLPLGNRTTYTVGQPMGTLGSFPMLDICNYVVALCAESETVPSRNPGSTFRIVGDDIIFNNILTQRHYINLMTSLGVPISQSKTYNSGKFAQAVGREIIKRDGYTYMIYPMKFSNHTYSHDKKMRDWYVVLFPNLIKGVTSDQRFDKTSLWSDGTLLNPDCVDPISSDFDPQAWSERINNLWGVISHRLYEATYDDYGDYEDSYDNQPVDHNDSYGPFSSGNSQSQGGNVSSKTSDSSRERSHKVYDTSEYEPELGD